MANIMGTFLPDILVGTSGDDTISAGGGNDVVSGGAGNDYIDGGTGDDILNGGDGDDVIYGGAGAATILSFYNGDAGNDLLIGSPDGVAENFNGGDGVDTVSFAMRNRAVDARLDIQSLPLLDSIIAVENLIGSRFNDTLTGNANANVLQGGLGADVLIGGAGIDTASYADDYGSVSVNLSLGRGFGNAAEGDTYSGIEKLQDHRWRTR